MQYPRFLGLGLGLFLGLWLRRLHLSQSIMFLNTLVTRLVLLAEYSVAGIRTPL